MGSSFVLTFLSFRSLSLSLSAKSKNKFLALLVSLSVRANNENRISRVFIHMVPGYFYASSVHLNFFMKDPTSPFAFLALST